MDDLDLSEFHDVFFEEADDHLRALETLLLATDPGAPGDPDRLDAIFRAAHSIKGGAAAFGFDDIAELTHEMETVFAGVRKGRIPMSSTVIDVSLQAGDRLKDMFAARRDPTAPAPPDAGMLRAQLRLLVDQDTAPVAASGPAARPNGDRDNRSLAETIAVPVPSTDTGSIRVSVQKVDDLINLVGELVITQAMLTEASTDGDRRYSEALLSGLALLSRNARELQEVAMSIRMMPMSFAFGRFPRLVRDLAALFDKQIDLVTEGDSAELDRGLIERIVDPLTHLIRNSIDHGIETPAERAAAGKPARGTILLRAFHRGGSIMVEVVDDGAGLDRRRLLAKARQRGMRAGDGMSEAEVHQLIFEPGFSTAEQVTGVSGRGVGMDVVRRNIRELGGDVEIDSTLGVGTRIAIRLPLTLAILDGMSVSVGDEVFIIPLNFIVESLRPAETDVRSIRGTGQVVRVRGEYLPLVMLHEVFNLPTRVARVHEGIVVVLKAEGRRTALCVDALVAQHQVVVKSLEANYRKVPGVSSATIMGDGRVALILDVPWFAGPLGAGAPSRDYAKAA